MNADPRSVCVIVNLLVISDLTYEPVLEPGTRLLEPGYPDSILVNK